MQSQAQKVDYPQTKYAQDRDYIRQAEYARETEGTRSAEECRIAEAVRAALGDLTPQPRQPQSIADSETLFVDLGLNSLEYLELWTSIESRLGCRFDDEDLLGDLRTVGDVVRRTMEVCAAEAAA